MSRVEAEHPLRQVEDLGHALSGRITPKFVPTPGGLGCILNSARRAAAESRFRAMWPVMFAPSEGLLDRIMREHFARTVR